MDNLLVLAFLGMIGALVWLHINKGNPHKLNTVRTKTKGLGGLYMVEKVLLLAAGLMGSLFAYGIFAPIWEPLGYLVGAMVIAFNFSEGFLIRLSIAAWRYGFQLVASLAALGVLMIMGYSLTAGASVIETFLGKNQDLQLAAQYKMAASQQHIEAAKADILTAQLKARALDQYGYLNNPDVAQAQAHAATIAAQENQRIAQVLETKTPEFKAAFGMSRDAIAFLVALALEFSILGVVIFTELFGKPTPLPALVRFANKSLDWNVNPHHLHNLAIEKSPAPETIALPYTAPQVGFAGALPYANPVQLDPVQAPSNPVHRVTQGSTRATPTQGINALHDANLAPNDKQDELFDLWVMKLRAGELKPSTEQTRLFISEHKLANGIKLIAALADSWLNRAYNIGVLALNPIQKNGVSKYILADTQQGRVELTKREGSENAL
ncbi:MAG: hypothetical protein WAQ53_10660 [Thiofilum sp.]|uniref:hypothetical protein n=1 Tax=Thiofilum sp. TaxID=2212733 RepID=UPI0025F70AFD|nr:hypothetical protein [Thiofilum sp.]MBK8453322.1 hypothetical protein [Thiofilum sp.]